MASPSVRRRSRSSCESGGGAIGALRSAFAASPRSAPPTVVVAAPVAYAEPMPVRYDAAYHLDAGDRLRVVVYGQEGLTNTYAIDAGGSITMPLIGSVPARGRTTARTGGGDRGETAQRLHQGALGRGGDRSLSAVLHPRRGRGTRPVSLRAEHDGRERGGDCRRLFAARAPRSASQSRTPMRPERRALSCRLAAPISSRRYRARRRALVLARTSHKPRTGLTCAGNVRDLSRVRMFKSPAQWSLRCISCGKSALFATHVQNRVPSCAAAM